MFRLVGQLLIYIMHYLFYIYDSRFIIIIIIIIIMLRSMLLVAWRFTHLVNKQEIN